MKDKSVFEATIYSRALGWYLLLNGIYTILVFFWVLYSLLAQGQIFANLVTVSITSVILPSFSIFLGFFIIKCRNIFIRYTGIYLLAAIPIFGYKTWLYSFAHGIALKFNITVSNFELGINFTAIIGLILLAKHLPNKQLKKDQ